MTQRDKITPARKLRQHRHDSNKDIFKNKQTGETGYRPMYNDMNKYGAKYFHIRVLCHCTPEEAPIKEKEYIALYPSEKLYNISLGGLGKSFITQEQNNIFITLYSSGKTILEISQITGNAVETIRECLLKNGYTNKEIRERAYMQQGSSVIQLNLDGSFVNKFNSAEEAMRALNKKDGSHIIAVCRGNRKTAYGYKWKYSN